MDSSEVVEPWLASARQFLPPQNPLWAFVHNNQIQAFEQFPFVEGIRRAGALYEAAPTETERFFREELSRGRITRASLEAVLRTRRPDAGPDPVGRFLADPTFAADAPPPVQSLRLAPRIEHLAGRGYERMFQDFLVPLVSTWLDQGMAGWPHPYGKQSFWAFFRDAVTSTPDWGFAFAPDLKRALARHAPTRFDVDDVIETETRAAAPDGAEVEYVTEVLFALKGWSGIVSRLELEPSLAPVESPPARLADWLAALLVTTHALDDHWLARLSLDRATLARTPAPIAESAGLGRLVLWQEAYERSFAVPFLAELERSIAAPVTPRPAPEVHVLTCMDDREESFRRALETDPGIETFGVVGFFNVDMRFSALGAARPTRQCPPVVEPSRALVERPHEDATARHERADGLRRLEAAGDLGGFYASRTLVRGYLTSLALGLASFAPLLLKVLAPRQISRLRAAAQALVAPHPRTRIELGGERGYDLAARADVVESLLRTCGLTAPVAPIVALVSHGATMTNNPFRQAYGCGACSGNPGSPNARVFAAMANDPAVRELLAARGLVLPPGTLFVPYIHDTTTDEVRLLDAEELPADRAAEIERTTARLSQAAGRNAMERVRRLARAPVHRGERAVTQHLLDRANDLAQPRPEYGHNRVAAAIVGRRRLTAKATLDRRCFLVSYDPTLDAENRWLAPAVLGSVPVAANIALDYLFSRTDPEGFGAGSKLPLNVAALLGVMTGSKSDLRIGLARQMTELHEPMRPLVLIEGTADRVRGLVDGNARLTRLTRNGWFQLGRVDPASGAIELFVDGAFVPWRKHLAESGADEPLAPVFDARFDRVVGQPVPGRAA